MLSIGIENYDGQQSVISAYGVSVTTTINALATLSFSFNATGQNLLAEGLIGPYTLFTTPDGQQYRLTTSNPVPNNEFRVYAISATHIGRDLNDTFVEDTLKGKQSLKACMDLVVKDTGFKYQIDDKFDDHDFGDAEIGNAAADSILSSIAEAWSCEYYFDNKTIHLAKSIGRNGSFLFIDAVNASHIAWTESYDSVKTAIKGYGKQVEQTTSSTDDSGDSGSASGGAAEFISYTRSFVGRVPYVWGGNTPSGWDCSGFVAYVYNHFGVPMHQPTTYEEFQGSVVGPPYQTGDMLFWGSRGGTYHVALALNSSTLVMAANPSRGTVQQAISAWSPDFGVRNGAMAAKLSGGSSSVSTSQSSDSETETDENSTPDYTCQTEYISPLADKKNIGKRWAEPYHSDTITDERALKAELKKQLHDYPDVQYTVDWISFTKNAGGFSNEIKIGNKGWLRDRMGTDVSVRIQSITQVLDDSDPSNKGSITFGNKIFDASVWNDRQKSAGVTKEQLEKLQRRINQLSNITTTQLPTMNSDEEATLDDYLKSHESESNTSQD